MLPRPHGGRLVYRVLPEKEQEEARRRAATLPALSLSEEKAREVENLATGVFSPLEGFMRKDDFQEVVAHRRLANGLPWTIPIILDVSEEEGEGLREGEEVALLFQGMPISLLSVQERYRYNKEELALQVFGTADPSHPGVAQVQVMKEVLLGGTVDLLAEPPTPFARYRLTPRETRVLFEAKGWRTVVGFQTRNVPHLGHEYVQKTALTFVDGIFVNPVIGRKKRGDFKDEVILSAYEALLKNYYLKERAVMAILQTEMRYAGPREAIFHAIIRKNFGCTHFIVGRDHAGVGNFYHPYAAQEIFDEFPDLGIMPLFFTAFFQCRRCQGVANEKTCPHEAEDRIEFSGTKLRNAMMGGGEADLLIRPEVAQVIRSFEGPFLT
ncbi:MAG: sulfate adenylyltransferase [candidate division NC10 bacterium]|nr:sulfate adenylyltransferase [candidate division NC10 bacterium]